MLRECRLCQLQANSEDQLRLFVADTKSKHGYANCCISCRQSEYKEYDAADRLKCPSKTYPQLRKYMLKSKYGLTLEAYDAMLEIQEGCCAICFKSEEDFSQKLSVDHCHKTGNVRGLLCKQCNLGIGNLKDSLLLLRNATEYLEGFEQ